MTEFSFEHEGKTFTLPAAENAAVGLKGRFLRDAAMDGQEGQMRLGFAMLENVGASDALDALYDKPADEMVTLILAWMEHKPEGGEPLGESSGSSN